MAVVEGDTFQIPIEGKDETGKAFSSVEKAVEDLNKQFAKASKAIEAASESISLSEKAFANAAQAQIEYQKISSGTIKSTEEMSSSFSSLSKIIETTANTIASISTTIEDVANAIAFLSDPKKLKRLSDLLQIISAFLRVKGKPELSESMLQLSKQTDILANKMEDLRTTAGSFFEETAEKARSFNTSLEYARQAIDGLVTGGLAFLGLKLTGQLDRLSNSLGILGNVTRTVENSLGNLSKTLGAKLSKNMLHVAKTSALTAPILVSIGRAAKESENEFIKLSGTISIVAGVILGAFSLALIGVLKIVADFSSIVGGKMIESLTIFEKEAIKSARSLSQFQFVIQGFNRVVGEDSVGSLAQWNEAIKEVVDNSTHGTGQVRKSVKLLVAEGSRIGLTFKETSELLKRSSDVAAASGKDIQDVTQAVISALVGQSQAALSLGLDIREAALSHSKLVESSGKAFSELSEGQKVMARLSEIFRQSEPVMGAAAKDLETVAGAGEKLDQKLAGLRIRLGAQTKFTLAYTRALQKLIDVFLSLPSPIIEVTGSLFDFLGVSLKVIGTVGKYSLVIASASTAYQVLNSFLATNLKLQAAVDVAFIRLGSTFGVATVQVTSLSGVLTNLVKIVRASLIAVFKNLLNIVASVALAIGKIVIASAPLIIKFVALAVIIKSLFSAVTNIIPQLEGFKKTLEILDEVGETITKTFEEFYKSIDTDGVSILGGFMLIIQNLSNILVSGLAGALTGAAIAWLKFKQVAFDSDKEAKETQKTIDSLTADMVRLGKTIEENAISIADIFSGKASAAIKKSGNEIITNIDGIAERFKNMGDSSKENAERAAEALKQLSDENRNLSFQIANMGATELEQIQNNFDFAIANLELREKELKASGALSDAVKKQIDLQRELLGIQADKAMSAAMEERTKKTIEAIERIRNQNKQFTIERLEAENQLVSAQELKNQAALEAFDNEIAKLEEVNALSAEQLAIVDETRAALIAKGQAELEAAGVREKRGAQKAAKVSGDVQLFGPQQVETITAAFGAGAGEAASAISGALGGFTTPIAAANMVADAVQGLIDAIPQLLSKIANIFNSLTDLPNMILQGLMDVMASLGNFFSNFMKNLGAALPKILMILINDLPLAIQDGMFQLLEQLPALLDQIIAAVPELVSAFITRLPKMFVKLLSFLIKEAPKIATALVKSLAVELPIAIAEGVALALSELGGIFSDLFKGIFPAKDIEEGIKNIGDSISRSTSQLFQVVDLEASARGLDVADRIRTAITSGASKGASWFDKAWTKIKNWFDKVFGGIIQRAWEFVVRLFNDLSSLVSQAWKLVLNFFENTFKTIWKEVLTPIIDFFTNVFSSLWDKALQPIVDFFSNVFQSVWDNALKPIVDFFSNVFQGNWEAALDNVIDWFKGFPRLISDAFTGVFDFFNDIGGNVLDMFKPVAKFFDDLFGTDLFSDAIDGLKNLLNAVNPANLFKKLFNIDGAWGQGTIEGAIGKVISGFDIPFVKFAEGGEVAEIKGNANVSGNSTANDIVPALLSPGEIVLNRTDAEAFRQLFPDTQMFGFGSSFVKAAQSAGGAISSGVKSVGGAVSSVGKSAIDSIGSTLGNAVDLLSFLNPSEILDKFKDIIIDRLFDSILNMFVSGASSAQQANINSDLPDFNNLSSGAIEVGQTLSALPEIGQLAIPSFGYNDGGLVGEDGTPIRVNPKEFVVNEEATRNNIGALALMNETKKPLPTGGNQVFNMEITINAKTNLTPETIKREVVPTIEKELRRKSSQGRYVINASGVRN